MSEHKAAIRWQRGDDTFRRGRYRRKHVWQFDGGAVVAASASPDVVPAPWSDPADIDPEEAFVASLSSCHMLWFLSLAAAEGLVVNSYSDDAIGHMREIAPQRHAITEVVLRPRVEFESGHALTPAQLEALHHAAHDHCFLANSVKTAIRIEPR